MDRIDEKTIIEYYKNRKLIPMYQISQLLELRKLDNRYQTVQSSKQIRTVFKHSSYHYFKEMRTKLIDLLLKHVNIENSFDIVTKMLSLPLSDSFFYKIIHDINSKESKAKHEHVINTISHRDKKVELFTFDVLRFINIPIKTYLDFGCGDCDVTERCGKSLKLDKEHIYGADINEWGNYNDKSRKMDKINFIKIEPSKPLDFPDKFFDVISCFMVLHHVNDLEFTLKELKRLLSDDGLLYVTEHMITNYMEKMLTDIEHSIYEIAYRENTNYHNTYINNFYHWTEWNIIMEKNGFTYVSHDYLNYDILDQNDPTKKAWIIYKKN